MAEGAWTAFRRTPLRVQLYLGVVLVAAVVLAALAPGSMHALTPPWLTAGVLVAISAMNIELGRVLAGGLSSTNQPHKALSAWAFASALLLPPPWLLVIVPVTYAHARWRGLVVPLWKWVGSAGFVVLAGVAASQVREAMLGEEANWMAADGGRGFLTMALAALAFLAAETVLFGIVAIINDAEDEAWLRSMLTGWSFYGTETAVLLIGGLLSAVWTGGPWFALTFVPIYALAQRAALHEPLRQRGAELERANQFKIDLMGMLGHELGNPLTSIQGFAHLGAEALARDDVAGARDALAVVERNAEQMRRVLLDILGLVTSEGGRLTAVRETCPLEPRLRAAAAAHSNGQRPAVECPDGLAVEVQAAHLDQILANLLSNADKYAGGATRLVARTTDGGRVEVAVVDGGPGVPHAFRGRLFERFSRDDGTAGLVRGSGLGLFISRELARANGGDVTHRDGDPRGAVFVLTLDRSS
ncbi:MAG: HAMP domain-containing histidine kinase [Nocardioidaceae bacterium]|nr:HAMP domain-containing histidine kinase [Nocardioidaceae bacterium]